MSYVIAAPEMMAAAATDLANVGSDLSAAHSAAAQATVALTPAAADEVSVGIAHLFSKHAAGFQALAGQAAVSHDQFVHSLKASAGAYTSAEAANAAALLPPGVGQLSNTLAISLPPELQNLIASFIRNPLIFVEQLVLFGFLFVFYEIGMLVIALLNLFGT